MRDSGMKRHRHVIIPIFIPHVGCPHDCVFCNQAKITGFLREEYARIDGDFVRSMVERYLATIDRSHTTLEVSFFGGTFTAIDIRKQRELLSVTKELKEKGIIDHVRLSTRPDYINLFILGHLKDHLVDIIELGVQSLDQEVLDVSKRGYTAKDVEDASRLIRSFGFVLGHQLMVGLPMDSEEKDLYSLKESIRMQPDIVRIYPALVLRDTELEERFRRGGFVPYDLDQAVRISAKMMKAYDEKGIRVIRIGLQPTEEITSGREVLAGPFHPSIRELCEGYLLAERILDTGFERVLVRIDRREVSKLYAGGKRYFNEMRKKIEVSVQIIDDGEPFPMEIIRQE